MSIKNLSILKKIVLCTVIFLLLEIIFILFYTKFEILAKINNNAIVTSVYCGRRIFQNKENQKYCSNIEGNLYNKIVNEKQSKYKVETITDEKGNMLNKKYKDIDENGVEKGSLSYVFDNGHQLLSEVAIGSFGDYKNESYYDLFYGDRIVLVRYKNNEDMPYSIIKFTYNHDKYFFKKMRPLYE